MTKAASGWPPERPEPLRAREDFDRVFRQGTRLRHGGISVVRAPSDGTRPRVGIVASRRVGGAVARNRAKRRIREAVRAVGLPAGSDYVVIATPEVLTAPFDRLCTWIARAGR